MTDQHAWQLVDLFNSSRTFYAATGDIWGVLLMEIGLHCALRLFQRLGC